MLALGLGVTALTGCSDNTGANYVTPSNVETIQNTIAEIGDQGVKVPEKRDLKVTLPESDKQPTTRLRSLTPRPSPSASPKRTSLPCIPSR